ncbi:hypothetical protein SDC9_134633 [bioreactor metagenome]|uniref:Uncharacterized protein n=1 Tax=bioreactor metagenome TaxID=1076179 RepID=A0A645DDP0_9ZZZZ
MRSGKNQLIALSVIALGAGSDLQPLPFVRNAVVCYEIGVVHIATWVKLLEVFRIAQNSEVAFSVSIEPLSGKDLGTN